MKHPIFTMLLALAYLLNYGQTTVKESKASNGVPIMFVDSVRIGQADQQKYRSDDIATVTVYKDSTKFKHLDSNAIGAIYIETYQFSRSADLGTTLWCKIK